METGSKTEVQSKKQVSKPNTKRPRRKGNISNTNKPKVNVLADVRSSKEIDGYNVTAKYVGAGEQDLPDFTDIKWYSEHVRKSQYLLQIIKRRNTECYRPRSGLFRLLDNRFFPPPVKVKQTVDDLVLDEEEKFIDLPVNLVLRLSTSLKDFLQMPYDYFCPTVKLGLSSQTCKTCGLYHAFVKSLNRHIEKIHKKVTLLPGPAWSPPGGSGPRYGANFYNSTIATDNMNKKEKKRREKEKERRRKKKGKAQERRREKEGR
ncbi:unnamed protein product [Psylliodes chrysocephalus]|uniref:C2H2-type domain-containing protein n=1 Tax=Psylliodes chrysocephalus TaxID=3402493 RepID=A0A9P0GDY8_9CUCU|nr:unnamed protein product [Psylliodes chrysocephala]